MNDDMREASARFNQAMREGAEALQRFGAAYHDMMNEQVSRAVLRNMFKLPPQAN